MTIAEVEALKTEFLNKAVALWTDFWDILMFWSWTLPDFEDSELFWGLEKMKYASMEP